LTNLPLVVEVVWVGNGYPNSWIEYELGSEVL